MSVANIIAGVRDQFAERWSELREMTPHERNHLLVCMALAFVIVYGLLFYGCR